MEIFGSKRTYPILSYPFSLDEVKFELHRRSKSVLKLIFPMQKINHFACREVRIFPKNQSGEESQTPRESLPVLTHNSRDPKLLQFCIFVTQLGRDSPRVK